MDLSLLLALATLGVSVGFMAGLLGIGGGGIMVPILTSIFLWQGFDPKQVVHLALGTSMASIVVTSFSSMRAHHRMQGVTWEVVRAMTPGIFVGTFIATFLVSLSNGLVLAAIFGVFMLCVSVQMFLGKQPSASRTLPSKAALAGVGSGIGGISALVSIGGGTLSVPFLYWHNLPMQRAIGTSAALGLPIAISGTLGYLIHGQSQSAIDTAWTYGFIYLPAVMVISVCSYFSAPLGVLLAYRLPVGAIKKVFAVLLFLLSAKMFYRILA